MERALDFDLIVIGGGPGGSALATLVAMQGHKVLLLEKEKFPRHQIGESLLPATIHGICPLLGVSEEIEKANFIRKLGGTFLWGTSGKPWTFNFSLSPKMPGPTSFAYQVERAKFDAILLDNAQRKGVDVRLENIVTNVLKEDGRVSGVSSVDAAGRSVTYRSRFVADTSGNLSRTYSHVGERIYSNFFRNVALYGYYEGGKRLPAPSAGNILCAAFRGGWFWYIPLTEKLTSVGVVLGAEHASAMRTDHENALREFIEGCPIIRDNLANATRVTEGMYGEVRMRKDYSYCCTRFWAPGMMLIGDAACFIDPVFSSGVHLATYSALLAARSINSVLRLGMDETTAFTEFEQRYRREFGNFYQFLAAFYEMNHDEDSYFWSARKILNSEEHANEAFVRLVGGVGTSGEPLFGSAQELIERRQSMGNAFERATSAVNPRGDFDMKQLDKVFVDGFNREIAQIQMQALTGKAAPEQALWKDGLIPTADGMHWRHGTMHGAGAR